MNVDLNVTISKVDAAVRLYNEASENLVHRRERNRWALVLKNTGTTRYMIGDKEMLSDNNHIVILPKGCSYSWKCVETGECLLIEFDALESFDSVLSFFHSDTSFFVRDFYKIQSVLENDQSDSGMEAIYRVYGILLQILKTNSREYVPRDKKLRLEPAVRYIAEQYHNMDITNDHMATLCGMSTVYFRKCFERAYGVSPVRYLHNFRMQKAKEILSSDYASISQAATSVGYSSLYHFSKMFKTYTGMSPTEYAKASRK